MNVYFLDTSALARRYVPEVGAIWVKSWIDPLAKHLIIISEVTTIEMMSLLSRRRREGSVPEKEFAKLRDDFLTHVEEQYRVISLSKDMLSLARDMVEKHPLRALDAIQLACALTADEATRIPLNFVCADKRLLDAAIAEGFSVDDPNNHPGN